VAKVVEESLKIFHPPHSDIHTYLVGQQYTILMAHTHSLRREHASHISRHKFYSTGNEEHLLLNDAN
jgi:hypothetical protein